MQRQHNSSDSLSPLNCLYSYEYECGVERAIDYTDMYTKNIFYYIDFLHNLNKDWLTDNGILWFKWPSIPLVIYNFM